MAAINMSENSFFLQQVTFVSELGQLRVDQVPEGQIPELYKLVQATASKTQKEPAFAADEFPTIEDFSGYASSGFAMSFTRVESGTVAGYGFITPAMQHR